MPPETPFAGSRFAELRFVKPPLRSSDYSASLANVSFARSFKLSSDNALRSTV